MESKIDSREANKYKNRGVVLHLIAAGECKTIAELSAETGVSKMGITNMITEMEEKNLVERVKTDKGAGLGRKPQILTIKPEAPKVVGVLIFRERCEAILCDFTLSTLKRETMYTVPQKNDELMELVFRLIDTVTENENNIAGIGVASIGPVDAEKGVILNPYFFNEVRNLPVAELIAQRYNVPVFLQQDNQCGALAEKLYGSGADSENMLFLGIGKGIGCGMVLDNKLYDNGLHIAPEIGHLCIEINGKPCVCGGRGCMEQYASVPVVLEKLRRITGSSLSFGEYCRLAETMPEVEQVIKEQIEVISTALINTINLLSLDTILLGYDGLDFTDRQIAEMQNYINRYKFERMKLKTRVKRAHFKEDAQLLGAACLVLSRIFKGELFLYE